MSRQDQINLLKRLLHYVDTRTTAMADSPWRNEVSAYTDPERLDEEQRVLFRQHPMVMGFASDWPAPGSFRTDDYAGVPVLIVRGRDNTLRAFLNVCRHRGAKVAQGCGKARVCSRAPIMPGPTISPASDGHSGRALLSGRARRAVVSRRAAAVRKVRSGVGDPDRGWFDKFRHRSVAGRARGASSLRSSFGSWSFYDRRVIPETMNWKIVVDTFNEGYHVGFLHRDSLRDILHGNVTDFEAFGLNHRLTFPRRKLERLKAEPEDKWDLMWNTTLVYSLFPNTVLLVQGDHVELARVFPCEGRADRSVMDLGLYVPKAPSTDEERVHWDKNMQLVLDVVTGEDFPTGRSIQIGLTSGAQTHTVYGRNEPAMIHYHQSMRTALGLRV